MLRIFFFLFWSFFFDEFSLQFLSLLIFIHSFSYSNFLFIFKCISVNSFQTKKKSNSLSGRKRNAITESFRAGVARFLNSDQQIFSGSKYPFMIDFCFILFRGFNNRNAQLEIKTFEKSIFYLNFCLFRHILSFFLYISLIFIHLNEI